VKKFGKVYIYLRQSQCRSYTISRLTAVHFLHGWQEGGPWLMKGRIVAVSYKWRETAPQIVYLAYLDKPAVCNRSVKTNDFLNQKTSP
jgi:hypothetical protein